MSCVGSNGGLARYRLTIEPWLRFLGVGRDSAVFQDMSVLDIVQSIFTDYQSSYQGSGKLAPAWRVDVLDANVYPLRSLTTQYQESDLAFVERLLAEEGLFYWFEHEGDASSATLGSHTLVIADHNAAFKPNARAAVRFSQSSGTVEDDTVDRWRAQAQWNKGYDIAGLNDTEKARIMYLCHHLGIGDAVHFIQNTIPEEDVYTEDKNGKKRLKQNGAKRLLTAQIGEKKAQKDYVTPNGGSWVKGHRLWLQGFIGTSIVLSAKCCPGNLQKSLSKDEAEAKLTDITDDLAK